MRTLCALLLLGGPLAAQPENIRMDRVRADLFFLASPALEGRQSGARGSEVALEWVAAEFAKAGLQPVAGTSFKQPVPVIEYRVDSRSSGLTVRWRDREESFRSPEASGSFPRDYQAKGEVVFAGFGITAPELGYDDYAGLDARGKIVLVFDDEPQEYDPASIFNGREMTLHATGQMKMTNALRHGAVALLTAAEPNRKHPAYRELLQRRRGAARSGPPVASQALDPGAPAIPVFSISDKLAAALIAAAGQTPAALQAAIDATAKPASLALPGVEAEVRIVLSERRRSKTANVVGMIEGSDPKLKNETVLVCGHYDHLGADGEAGYMPGADDNASGTAGLVELARVFAASPVKPRRTLVFAALAAEERGLLGAYHYTLHPPRPLETTRAVLNLDMIGRNEAETVETKGLIEIAADTSNELNLMALTFGAGAREAMDRANAGVGLQLNDKWDREPALRMLARSDHYPFLLRGIPAVFFFTGMHPDYHTARDTPDTVNYAKMGRILKLAWRAASEFAGTDNPPRFRATTR
ncbi:MAG: M28 family peptidase [Acidobacteria bacterium]|nr:M28 family peptidase [Acidobacteriota bacterium]